MLGCTGVGVLGEGMFFNNKEAQPLEERHVGIPAYPGAKITLLTLKDQQADQGCILTLGTNDAWSDIVAFYKKALDPDQFNIPLMMEGMAYFASKTNPDNLSVSVHAMGTRDGWGFDKQIVIHFQPQHGYKCLMPTVQ